jgi:magnesium transporter
VAELGVAAFFIGGIVQAQVGTAAPWFVLGAVVALLAMQVCDIESWVLFVPGGLPGRARLAFGPGTGAVAAAAVLVDRLLFAGVAALVAGHYAISLAGAVLGSRILARGGPPAEIAEFAAVSLIGLLWIRARLGRGRSAGAPARWAWIGLAVPAIVVALGAITAVSNWQGLPPLWPPGLGTTATGWMGGLPPVAALALAGVMGIGYVLPGVGTGNGLARLAAELPQPRLPGLRRTVSLLAMHGVLVTFAASCLFIAIVPGALQTAWFDAPFAGLAWHAPGPLWLQYLIVTAVTVAATLVLGRAVDAGLADAQSTLHRLSQRGVLPDRLTTPHPRFGTPARVIDAAAATAAIAIVASGGRVSWLARAYAVGVAWTCVLKVAALVRLRARGAGAGGGARPASAARGLQSAALVLTASVIAVAIAVMLAAGDVATWAGMGALAGLALALSWAERRSGRTVEPGADETFELVPSGELSLDRVEARPGSLLVAVRHPRNLGHLEAAIRVAADREVVVMTARLIGIDVEDERGADDRPTDQERFLFSQVAALAERHGRAVRLLIVPAHDAFDAVVAAVVRLQASEVHVGESMTLSADDQAQRLGAAWERAPRAEPLQVRLVIHHRSGRADSYYLGAHAPALSSRDLDLIHELWLDAAKTIGPHVHHHDIVRAALTNMAQQLDGPHRDEAVDLIRRVARPEDELAAVVHARDFSRLRDMMRNRPPRDLAEVLPHLAIEDQVVLFRVLPRKDAAAAFEYLSRGEQEALLKAMAQEDVAALLNDMAPDDRTMFLEELPASATQRLLALLTPGERSVAVRLLGYPEGSIGRLMTPQYVRIREDWTVQRVLDHVREHGEDSETLNVIYVVDEQGVLIDDIRIREILLAQPTRAVADLMDRRFVALKATDDQEAAVAVFREHDRSALPVTDTAGVLIGIVTIDDVLDVAEAVATADIQRLGGSEALDEPYMRIAFTRMVKKRAGWLTALFLGEMLTATAMGVFEREIERAVVLALFVPLIISSGGNSGSQASTLVIRALALGELGLRNWWQVMRREINAGLALGTILGSIGFLRIALWSAFTSIYGPHWLLVAVTVAVALVGVVLWGTLVGSLLPFLLRRLGFDPATSSAPFVATLVDVTGLVIYFTVGIVILHGTLL